MKTCEIWPISNSWSPPMLWAEPMRRSRCNPSLIISQNMSLSKLAPLEKIKIGFGDRYLESPCIYMLIWPENAPVFHADVVAYIDNIIICCKLEDNSQALDLVNWQTHRHLHTCWKKPQNICRFSHSQLSIRCTQIFIYLMKITLWLRVKPAKNCGKL